MPNEAQTEIEQEQVSAEPASEEQAHPTLSNETLAEFDALTEPNPNQPNEPGPEMAEQAVSAEPIQSEGALTKADVGLAPKLEDDEIIASIQSERGKNRVREIISSKRQAEEQATQLRSEMESIRQLLVEASMDQNSMAEYLSFNKLLASGNIEDLRKAADIAGQVYKNLLSRVGEPTADYDPVSEFPDLMRMRDETFDLSPELALQSARERKERQQLEARLRGLESQHHQQQQIQANLQQAERDVQNFQIAAQRYFDSKSKDPDFAEKVRIIQDKFKDPQFAQNFHLDMNGNVMPLSASLKNLQMMYESIVATAPARSPQPLRSRPQSTGARTSHGLTGVDRLASILDQMNI